MPAITKVEISFFKPTGFADTYWVRTEDRGLAARTVMAKYDALHLPMMNYISTDLRDERGAVGCTILEPISEAPVVAWRCKDYADGWIIYQDEEPAAIYQDQSGCLVQTLVVGEAVKLRVPKRPNPWAAAGDKMTADQLLTLGMTENLSE